MPVYIKCILNQKRRGSTAAMHSLCRSVKNLDNQQVMAALPTDISFYIGKQELESLAILDVPLSNGEIVSINLVDELPDDPNELIGFLETENCPLKYWISVAQAYGQLNKLDESLTVINTGITKFQDISLKVFRGWLYVKFITSGNKTYIEKLLQELQENSEETLEVLSLRAVFAFLTNRDEDALRLFEKLLSIDELNAFALIGKAQVVMRRGTNYNMALKLFQQALIINPIMKPDPRIGIGLCFWFLKDSKMALKSWQRVLQLDEKNLKALILVNLYNFNHSFNNSLSDEDFVQNYTSCLEKVNENLKLSNNDPVILLILASYYFSKKNYQLVERIVNKIIQDINMSSTALQAKLSKYQLNLLSQASYWFGRCNFVQGNFTQSQRYFHESTKFDETNFASKLGLGLSQISRKLNQEAMITFEQLKKANPKNLEVNYCLGFLNAQSKSRKRQELAIQFLERYISLSNNRGLSSTNNDTDVYQLNREPINLNAYLLLSKLYENKDINQCLHYLNKEVESRSEINKDVPVEVYNNIGVFNFNKGNTEIASKNFQLAIDSLEKVSDAELKDDLKITLNFNLARSIESSGGDASLEKYTQILDECPNYFSAKLRLLFLNLVSDKVAKEEIKDEIDQMLNEHASNLEIRSFYGWFIKTYGKKMGMKPDADTNHQKDTLVKYDSHDSYALISLANIYCLMARDLKGSSNDEKKKKYYVRAIELFSKVLSTDSKNVFAAQGLAIVYIENKELNKGLDILRKIRDSLNDISIFLNLAHVLLELKQFNKAIENYEIALNRFTNGQDSNILNYLSKSWLLRGTSEKNLSYLNKSLEYSEKALEYSSSNQKNSMKFNISYIYFQMADMIIKLPVTERKIEALEQSMERLNEGISILNDLAESENEKGLPYSKNDLKSRANLGNTLLNRLTSVLEDTKEYNSKVDQKLQEAQKVREEEVQQRLKQQEEEALKLKQQEEERAKEREKLQEQAKIWAEESRAYDEEDNDDKLFDEESNKDKKKSTKGKGKGKGKGKKGKGKKKEEDSESNTDISEPEPEPEAEEPEDAPTPEPETEEPEENGKRKRKNVIDDDDEDDDDVKKQKTIDSEDDDDGLF